MKKILILIFIMGFLISCGGNVGSSGGNKDNGGDNPSSKGNDEDPCERPSADDGETPPALPTC